MLKWGDGGGGRNRLVLMGLKENGGKLVYTIRGFFFSTIDRYKRPHMYRWPALSKSTRLDRRSDMPRH